MTDKSSSTQKVQKSSPIDIPNKHLHIKYEDDSSDEDDNSSIEKGSTILIRILSPSKVSSCYIYGENTPKTVIHGFNINI